MVNWSCRPTLFILGRGLLLAPLQRITFHLTLAVYMFPFPSKLPYCCNKLCCFSSKGKTSSHQTDTCALCPTAGRPTTPCMDRAPLRLAVCTWLRAPTPFPAGNTAVWSRCGPHIFASLRNLLSWNRPPQPSSACDN